MHYVPTMIHRRGLLRQVTCSDTPCFPVPLIALGVLCFTAPLFCHVTIIHIPPNQKLTFHLVKVGCVCVCVCVCGCVCVCACMWRRNHCRAEMSLLFLFFFPLLSQFSHWFCTSLDFKSTMTGVVCRCLQ